MARQTLDETERIERRLKLHDLRVLMSVVEQGSMARAAERLATSQPAISRAVAELEHSLGVRLLDRSPRGVVPTPYGRALIKRGVAVFDELRMGVKDLEFLADPAAGQVRIAAPVALAAGFATAVMDRIARRYPRVVCHLIVGDTPVNVRALEAREVDLVIARIGPSVGEDPLQAEILYADSQLVVAASANQWSRRRKVGLADLVDEPWTLPPLDSADGVLAAAAFRAAGLDVPRATVITSSGVARIALVANGRFLTIAPEFALKFLRQNTATKALPIDLPTTRGSVGIITLKNRTLTPVAQIFTDVAHTVAKRFTHIPLAR
jgi:DNA-binding transcriptional LysR family regulator